MSLISICQDVAGEVGWPVPQAVASNQTDATAIQMFALARKELEALADKNWPHLDVDYSFSTIIGQDTYVLPEDARVLMQNSAYDKSQYFGIRGSVGSQEWLVRKYGMLANLWCTTFRVLYNPTLAIQLDTTPQEVRDLTISYRSSNLAIAGASISGPLSANEGDSIPNYMGDSDVPRIPERLVKLGLTWRFRRAKGLDFSAELAEYNATVEGEFAQYKAQADIPVGRSQYFNTEWPLTQGYVPQTGFGL